MSGKNIKKECDICGEFLNKSNRRPIKCSYDECGSECCVVCFNRYLLESTLNPTCMFCNKDVSIDFIWEVSTQKFYNEYIDYRTLIIMVRQKSLIPGSQHLAEEILNERKIKILIKDMFDDILVVERDVFFIKDSLSMTCNKLDLKLGITNFSKSSNVRENIHNMNWIDESNTRCVICDYKFSYANICDWCNFRTCKPCFKMCLTQKKDSCLLCNHPISEKIIIDSVPKTFYNKYIKEKKITKKTKIENFKDEKILELVNKKVEVNNKISELTMQIYKYKNAKVKKEVEKTQFIKACPSNGCRGFLSSAYKCGICEKFFCPDCEIEKKSRSDETHVCDENIKASIALLKKNTRPCPKCSTPIEKSEGCFARNTKIPLFNGYYKMSQDIEIGDVLIGDDGEPRIVKALLRGIDKMYKIKQDGGIDYIVNSKHKLVLKCKEGKIYEICVEDYIKLNKKLYGYKSIDSTILINIVVDSIGKDNYYGWEIDNNHRFVLSDFTVVRNCDQMYCIVPNCKTAFSWKTGKIDKGVIHNPEYYRQQRELNNGVIPRNVGDNPCGGFPTYQDMLIVARKNPKLKYEMWYRYHQLVNHVRQVLIPDLPTDIGNIDYEDLRVNYIVGDIDEDEWKKLLKIQIKKSEKQFRIYQILDMYVHASSDIFMNFIDNLDANAFTESSRKLIRYADEQIEKINKRFKSTEKKYLLKYNILV